MATTQTTPDVGAKLDQSTVLLVVRMGMLGNRRKVRSDEVDVTPTEQDPELSPSEQNPEPEAVHVAKEMLASPELKAVAQLQGEVRHYIYARSLPNYHILKGSVHRIPLALVSEVDAELLGYADQQDALVEKFVQALPSRIAEARHRLGALFKAKDYPSAEQARGAFKIQFRYLTADVPTVLGMISQGLMARERANAVAEMASEAESIKLAMRQSFAELIDHMAERLGSRTDGKKMVFKDSTVQNMTDFFSLFDKRNVVGDQELTALVQRARQVMQGVDPDSLRKDGGLRSAIQTSLRSIKSEMDANLMLRPVRKLIME